MSVDADAALDALGVLKAPSFKKCNMRAQQILQLQMNIKGTYID